MRDTHTHAPGNATWLCPPCHRWVHDNPLLARQSGYIVSTATADPASVVLYTAWGPRLLGETGGFTDLPIDPSSVTDEEPQPKEQP